MDPLGKLPKPSQLISFLLLPSCTVAPESIVDGYNSGCCRAGDLQVVMSPEAPSNLEVTS